MATGIESRTLHLTNQTNQSFTESTIAGSAFTEPTFEDLMRQLVEVQHQIDDLMATRLQLLRRSREANPQQRSA